MTWIMSNVIEWVGTTWGHVKLVTVHVTCSRWQDVKAGEPRWLTLNMFNIYLCLSSYYLHLVYVFNVDAKWYSLGLFFFPLCVCGAPASMCWGWVLSGELTREAKRIFHLNVWTTVTNSQSVTWRWSLWQDVWGGNPFHAPTLTFHTQPQKNMQVKTQ